MKKRYLRFLGLLVAAVMLFSGCSRLVEQAYQQAMMGGEYVAFADMEYARPDMEAHDRVLEEACQAAKTSTDPDEVAEQVYAYYDVYDRFYTDYALADIHYSADLTDSYWEEEYQFCSMNTAQVDAGLEELYYALASSPILEQLEGEDYFGPGFFDAYQGEYQVDEELMQLMEQELELQNRYYEISEEAMAVEYYSEEYFSVYGSQMEALFVELIALRQQIAAVAGYDSYPEFVYETYHYRDFTPQQAEQYLQQVGVTLAPLYEKWAYGEIWEQSLDYCTQAQTFAYVKSAAEAMGGSVAEAFGQLEQYGLYDIGYGVNKYNSSFEIYLWSYYQPFVFMNPYKDQTDKLTFAHEFGHFCNDYTCWGSYVGTDVAEVQSQGMEYMSLVYADGGQDMVKYKMVDSLNTYIEQSAYALFELQVYDLEAEELTVENVRAIYETIHDDFGFDAWEFDSRDYVNISHFYTDPMYVVSYVVSNDVAMQMYQLELEEPGKGLEVYSECLTSMDSYIITFAESYGLESPFAPGRLEKVKKTMEESLGG